MIRVVHPDCGVTSRSSHHRSVASRGAGYLGGFSSPFSGPPCLAVLLLNEQYGTEPVRWSCAAEVSTSTSPIRLAVHVPLL